MHGVRRAAARRNGHLGELYDIRTDRLCGDSIVQQVTWGMVTETPIIEPARWKNFAVNAPTDRLDIYDVCNDFKLNALSWEAGDFADGTDHFKWWENLKKFIGADLSYGTDFEIISSMRRSLMRNTLHIPAIADKKLLNVDALKRNPEATHVVVEVEFGVRAYLRLCCTAPSEYSKNTLLSDLQNADANADVAVFWELINQSSASAKLWSGVLFTSREHEDAESWKRHIRMCQSLAKDNDNRIGVPQQFTLIPISDFLASLQVTGYEATPFRQISEPNLTPLISTFEEISFLINRVKKTGELVGSVSKWKGDLLSDGEKVVEDLLAKKNQIRSLINEVRSGSMEEADILLELRSFAELKNTCEEFFEKCEKLKKLRDEEEKFCKPLQRLGMRTVGSMKDLSEELKNVFYHHDFAFVFFSRSFEGDEQLLKNQKVFEKVVSAKPHSCIFVDARVSEENEALQNVQLSINYQWIVQDVARLQNMVDKEANVAVFTKQAELDQTDIILPFSVPVRQMSSDRHCSSVPYHSSSFFNESNSNWWFCYECETVLYYGLNEKVYCMCGSHDVREVRFFEKGRRLCDSLEDRRFDLMDGLPKRENFHEISVLVIGKMDEHFPVMVKSLALCICAHLFEGLHLAYFTYFFSKTWQADASGNRISIEVPTPDCLLKIIFDENFGEVSGEAAVDRLRKEGSLRAVCILLSAKTHFREILNASLSKVLTALPNLSSRNVCFGFWKGNEFVLNVHELLRSVSDTVEVSSGKEKVFTSENSFFFDGSIYEHLMMASQTGTFFFADKVDSVLSSCLRQSAPEAQRFVEFVTNAVPIKVFNSALIDDVKYLADSFVEQFLNGKIFSEIAEFQSMIAERLSVCDNLEAEEKELRKVMENNSKTGATVCVNPKCEKLAVAKGRICARVDRFEISGKKENSKSSKSDSFKTVGYVPFFKEKVCKMCSCPADCHKLIPFMDVIQEKKKELEEQNLKIEEVTSTLESCQSAVEGDREKRRNILRSLAVCSAFVGITAVDDCCEDEIMNELLSARGETENLVSPNPSCLSKYVADCRNIWGQLQHLDENVQESEVAGALEFFQISVKSGTGREHLVAQANWVLSAAPNALSTLNEKLAKNLKTVTETETLLRSLEDKRERMKSEMEAEEKSPHNFLECKSTKCCGVTPCHDSCKCFNSNEHISNLYYRLTENCTVFKDGKLCSVCGCGKSKHEFMPFSELRSGKELESKLRKVEEDLEKQQNVLNSLKISSKMRLRDCPKALAILCRYVEENSPEVKIDISKFLSEKIKEAEMKVDAGTGSLKTVTELYKLLTCYEEEKQIFGRNVSDKEFVKAKDLIVKILQSDQKMEIS